MNSLGETLFQPYSHPPRYLEVASVEYGHPPAMVEYVKSFFVKLKFPPPSDFRVESAVRLHLRPGIGIDTGGMEKSVFLVDDIIGTTVILKKPSSHWKPDLGGSNGWGYDMRRVDVRPSRQDWNYGYGAHQSFLEYYPRRF